MNNDILSWSEQIEQAFAELIEKYNIDLSDNRNLSNKIDSLWKQIYNIVFKPSKDYIRTNYTNTKLKLNNISDMIEVFEAYKTICMITGTLPKYNTFCELIGIAKYTIDIWHNANKLNKDIVQLNNKEIQEEYNNNIILIVDDKGILESNKTNIYIYNNMSEDDKKLTSMRLDVKKKIQEAAQNFTRNNLQTSSVGAMASANNDREIGLLWEPKNMILKNEVHNNYISANDLANKYGIEG